MQLTIDLPDRQSTLDQHRRRWDEVLQDRDLAKLSSRIETNITGQIIMSPPPSGAHSLRQYRIARSLESFLGDQSLTECPVVTSDGVKAIDAAWYEPVRLEQVSGQRAFEIAPNICVEVLSPANTLNEMRNKFRLYFDAGAAECWLCDLEGRMTFFLDGDAEKSQTRSRLCPDFPSEISD